MRISMCYKRFLFVFFFAILCFHITPSVVMGMSGQRSHAQSCKPGNTFEVTITIEYTEDIMVIGLQETIPAGWEYVSASCDIQGAILPRGRRHGDH